MFKGLRRTMTILACALFSTLVPATFGLQNTAALAQGGEVRVLKLVTPHNNTEFHYKAGYVPFIEEVEKGSQGKIKIDFYPSETLVKAKATPEAIQQGIADIGYIVTTYHPAMFPLSDVWALPMLFTSAVQGWGWDNKIKEKFWDPTYDKAGMVCLGRFLTTPYYIFTTRREIKSIKDLEGLRLKTPGAPGTAYLKALGAQGINVSTWDVYEALSRSTLDGVIHAPAYIQTAKWNELGKPGYLLMGGAGVSGSSSSLVMNKKVYESLSPELQKVVLVAGEHWGYNISKAYDDHNVQALDAFKEAKMVISTFSAEDQKKLKELAGPVWDQWISENEAKGHPARELLQELKKLGGGDAR